MSQENDVRLQNLTLKGVIIDLGGTDVAALITHGEVGTTTRGISTDVKTRTPRIPATLTITVLREDRGHFLMMGIYNAATAENATPAEKVLDGTQSAEMPGPTLSRTQSGRWSDAHFTGIPDFGIGTAVNTGTYVLDLFEYTTEVTEEATA